ncbi:MAG: 6-phosphogluconolactonase [Alphaproteobacteria bacterium]|nr:6-phosphogluconolactonase [Alphaproteobacteria bacterium]
MSGTDKNMLADKESLAEELAAQIAAALDRELQANGRALLAVSGGSTPKLFFQKLSEKDIDWAGVTVTLVDERWVDETSERSNAALVKANLLTGKAAAANFFPLYTGDETPVAGLKTLEDQFDSVGIPITAAILGMGGDGHTASFFPEGDKLSAALNLGNEDTFIEMHAPGAGEPRITFTLPALLKADFLALHIEGEEKQQVLATALSEGPIEDMPIRAVLRQNEKELTIFWCP